MAEAEGGRPVEAVAADVNRIAVAIEQAREAGLPLDVPEGIAQACRRIITLVDAVVDGSDSDDPASERDAGSATSRRGRDSANIVAGTALATSKEAGRLARRVPLRQMVWMVIQPGEEVAVGTVVERLRQRGLDWPANKVSNALGYWVERGRLQRSRKGVYQAPDKLPDLDLEGWASTRRDQRVGVNTRGAATSRGKESHLAPMSELSERRAM